MNIDELKTAWKAYDRKLQSTQAINEKIIISMISERSGARFARVKQRYLIGFLWMAVCLSFGFAILLGNPFDYDLTLQYVPTVIYCACLAILIISMVRSFMGLRNITISHNNLDVSLKKIIAIYEKPRQFIRYIIIIFLFSQVVLFPLSFLPRGIERMGLWPALGERLIPIAIAALMLWIAHKLGAFKERHGKDFRNDLNELEELKALSSELSDGE